MTTTTYNAATKTAEVISEAKDRIARISYEKGENVEASVTRVFINPTGLANFGPEVYQGEGALDRAIYFAQVWVGHDSHLTTVSVPKGIDPAHLIDYRSLLSRYIEHVGECEGTVFLSSTYRDLGGKDFTDAEWAELERLADETQSR